ncbi:MAG TPA: hypothetical protein VHZ81_04740 [Galbitalea sp.]|jgi:hypothetical protein|nr:hypothetical protein [Galbitalea sp.]
MAITLVCMLWSRPGQDDALIAYEDGVLELLADHDGILLNRLRSDGLDGRAVEVQIFEFPSDAELDGYLGDPRRAAMSRERDAAIARTELMRVEPVE